MAKQKELQENELEQIKEKIQQSIELIVEKSLSTPELLMDLKKITTKHAQYKVAANLLEVERALYPEKKEAIEAQIFGKKLMTAFGMVEIGTDAKTAWTMHEVSKMIIEKDGKYDIADAAKIKATAIEYFGK